MKLSSRSKHRMTTSLAAGVLCATSVTPNALAQVDEEGITEAETAEEAMEEGTITLDAGFLIQGQYRYFSPDNGFEPGPLDLPTGDSSTDELRFARVRPYLSLGLNEEWTAIVEWDFGEAVVEDNDDIALMDAYFQWRGHSMMSVSFGNRKVPYSRAFLTNAGELEFPDRSLTGDQRFGVPGRQLGVHLRGNFGQDTNMLDDEGNQIWSWAASAGEAGLEPTNQSLTFVSLANEGDETLLEGGFAAGRIDFHPLGYVPYAQGFFEGENTGFTLSLGAFTWSNDDDIEIADDTQAVDSADGYEVSAGLRMGGFSADAQYNWINSELKDGNVTAGLYEGGETDLETASITVGYMFVPNTFEAVVEGENIDADNYEESWTRLSLGANWYVREHNIKFQAAYRAEWDANGVVDSDGDTAVIQAQYMF